MPAYSNGFLRSNSQPNAIIKNPTRNSKSMIKPYPKVGNCIPDLLFINNPQYLSSAYIFLNGKRIKVGNFGQRKTHLKWV
jgi:hypothetical protein